MKIKTFKNNAYTTFERVMPSGYYVAKVYGSSGNLIDKVTCDDYRSALNYLKSFNAIAKNN